MPRRPGKGAHGQAFDGPHICGYDRSDLFAGVLAPARQIPVYVTSKVNWVDTVFPWLVILIVTYQGPFMEILRTA